MRRDDKGISPYPNTFRVTTLGNVIEKEPNDDQAHATPFEPIMAVNGVIGKPGDVDHFVFKATQGQVFDVHCYARRIRSPLDSVMYLGKKGGGAMLGSDDAVGPDSYFRFQAPETAEYVIWLVKRQLFVNRRLRQSKPRTAGCGRGKAADSLRGESLRYPAKNDPQR